MSALSSSNKHMQVIENDAINYSVEHEHESGHEILSKNKALSKRSKVRKLQLKNNNLSTAKILQSGSGEAHIEDFETQNDDMESMKMITLNTQNASGLSVRNFSSIPSTMNTRRKTIHS